MDAAFPALAGRWRVGTGGAALVGAAVPAGTGLVGWGAVGEWTHAAEAHIRAFDRGQGFPANRRVRFRPCGGQP